MTALIFFKDGHTETHTQIREIRYQDWGSSVLIVFQGGSEPDVEINNYDLLKIELFK